MSFIQYFTLIIVGLSLIGMFGYTFSRAHVSNKRIFEVINKKPEITSGEEMKKVTNGNIVFKNVSFDYHTNNETKNVLRNINLNIKQGE